MIKVTHGDILRADAEALVNTVNCVGVMGRGIALQFKKAFPDNFHAYKKACDLGEVRPGRMLVFHRNRLLNPRLIINFPTKCHWKGKSRMEDIRAGLEDLVQILKKLQVKSVAIPPLGSGLGGLDWREVKPAIEQALAELPGTEVFLYEPEGAPPSTGMVDHTASPAMTPGRAALLGLIGRYLEALMDVSVSLLELHKLMYFLQEAGEPLRLRYDKAPYGPYAENLRHVLNRMEGHMISGFGEGTDAPDKPIEPLGDALVKAESFLQDHPETKSRFDRVSNLISGFETPFGLELLSTVHWVATREQAEDLQDATARTYRWSPRKRAFSKEHIAVAWTALKQQGWIQPRAH